MGVNESTCIKVHNNGGYSSHAAQWSTKPSSVILYLLNFWCVILLELVLKK